MYSDAEETFNKYEAAYLGVSWVADSDHDEYLLFSYSKLAKMVFQQGVAPDDVHDFINSEIVAKIQNIALLFDSAQNWLSS